MDQFTISIFSSLKEVLQKIDQIPSVQTVFVLDEGNEPV